MSLTRFRFIASLGGFSLLFLSVCSHSKKLARPEPGHYAAIPVIVDGDDSEWPSPYPNYDSKAMLSYAIVNDSGYLYVSVKAGDPMVKRKLLAGGLTVWVDPSGKKLEAMAIQYPQKGSLPAMPPEGLHKSENGDPLQPPGRDTAKRHHPELQMPNDISFVGFPECNGVTTINRPNSCGIQVKMKTNSWDELVWEAAIPLTTLYGPQGGAQAFGKPVSICIEAGALPMPARDGEGGGGMQSHGMGGDMQGAGMPGGGMPGGGGMGMGGGGGMHGGPHGGGGPGFGEDAGKREMLSKTSKIWIQTSIARP